MSSRYRNGTYMDVPYVRDLRYERVKETHFCEYSISRFWRIFLFFDSIVFKLLRCFSLYRIGSITLRKLYRTGFLFTPERWFVYWFLYRWQPWRNDFASDTIYIDCFQFRSYSIFTSNTFVWVFLFIVRSLITIIYITFALMLNLNL